MTRSDIGGTQHLRWHGRGLWNSVMGRRMFEWGGKSKTRAFICHPCKVAVLRFTEDLR